MFFAYDKINPHVAIVIFDSKAPEGDGDGVYFEANVTELMDSQEIEHAIQVLSMRVTKDEFRVKHISEINE